MNTITASPALDRHRLDDRRSLDDRHSLDDFSKAYAFPALVFWTGLVLLRPQDLVPGLEVLRLNALMGLFGALLLHRQMTAQIGVEAFRRNPVTLCVLGLLMVVMLSHAVRGEFRLTLVDGARFCLAVIFYLQLVAVLDCEARIRRYTFWLAIFLTTTASVSLLAFWDVVALGAEPRNGRLESFNGIADPNFMAVLLVLGLLLSTHLLCEQQNGWRRCGWLAAISVQLAAFVLTASRGGFLALVGSLSIYGALRLGLLRTLVLAGLAGALLIPRLGRMATISESFEIGGTGDARLYLWQKGLADFANAPICGIGAHGYKRQNVLVLHNSFLETFIDLGFFGGCLFLGAFLLAGVSLLIFIMNHQKHDASAHARLQPCLVGVIFGFSVGLLSLSSEYQLTTYLVLALVTGSVGVAARRHTTTSPFPRFSMLWILAAGAAFLVGTKLVVI